MRVKIFLVSVAALLLWFNFAGAADFEGKISQQSIFVYAYELENVDSMAEAEKVFAKSNDQLRQMAAQSGDEEAYSEELADIYIKGDAFVVESREDGQRMTVIFDGQSSNITTLMHDQKMAMVTDMNAVEGMGDQMSRMMGEEMMDDEMMGYEMDEEDRFSMKSTGETRTINGFKCELYKGTDSEGDFSHMWIHRGYADVFETLIAAFSKLDASGAASEMDKEEQFFKKIRGIPILTKSISMGDLNISEIKEISKQSVPKEMFKVPADYQKMDMQKMMDQQMKQMQQMMEQ